MSKTNLTNTPELLGAFLNVNDTEALKADTIGYLKENMAIDLSDAGIDINVVENTGNTMHVALPYYAKVVSKVKSVPEDELDAASGGYNSMEEEYGIQLTHEFINEATAFNKEQDRLRQAGQPYESRSYRQYMEDQYYEHHRSQAYQGNGGK